MSADVQPRYGLPSEVVFCKRCVMSNQRPASMPEFQHTPERRGATYMHIGPDGVCDACRHAETKESIDWKLREEELLKLLDRHRRSDGRHDCIVPGSGGKDSAYQAHILKTKYGMNPLTVTWPPTIYTDYGYKNFLNWIEQGGFHNITFRPNGSVHRKLTRLAVQNLLHPFQTFILGQKNLAPKLAIAHKIPLIFYGENEAEYGNPLADNSTSLRDKSFFVMRDLSSIYLSGLALPELFEKHQLSLVDVAPYLPAPAEDIASADIEVHYLGYYLRWIPQEVYYYATEYTGFEARPFRSEGTFSKYNSIDDKIDDLHYYTTWIKFGIGRATYDASQEIRNRHITREEGVQLVRQFDGEFPQRYFQDILDYLGLDAEEFLTLTDQFRSPHLWSKQGDQWSLRHQVFQP